MSQKLNSCVNNINPEKVHCDSYNTKLMNKNVGRRNVKSAARERSQSISRNSSLNNAIPNINLPAMKNKALVPRQPVPDGPIASIIRKEVFDTACVEVTVKAHSVPTNRPRPRSRSSSVSNDNVTWGKILKTQVSLDNMQASQFSCFDPLRTLHFLARELQTKISDSIPQDSSIHQMVMDMQQALNRVPPEVASSIILQQAPEPTNKKSSTNIKETKTKAQCCPYNEEIMEPEKLVPSPLPKSQGVDRSIQTIKSINYAETEKLQKHLEESTEKIEMFCKQMESVCNRLKNEKLDLEKQLKAERETVRDLTQKLEDMEHQKMDLADTVARLHLEKEEMSLEVKKVKAHLETETGPSSENLKRIIQELRDQKAEVDQEVISLKHELTVVTMKKEKYVAILSARDKQIQEIRGEMNQLQELVKEELNEIQNMQFSSTHSSTSNITAPQSSWNLLTPESKHYNSPEGDIAPNLNSSTLQRIFLNENTSSFRELPSGDSSGTSTVIHEMQKNGTMHKIDHNPKDNLMKKPRLKLNRRDMFDQITKQAFGVQFISSSDRTPEGVDSYASANRMENPI